MPPKKKAATKKIAPKGAKKSSSSSKSMESESKPKSKPMKAKPKASKSSSGHPTEDSLRRSVFRNFKEACEYYQYPSTHRTGTIAHSLDRSKYEKYGNAADATHKAFAGCVIRSYSANHLVDVRLADGTKGTEWKDQFDIVDEVETYPSGKMETEQSCELILYRLKDESIEAMYRRNEKQGKPLRFFKKLEGGKDGNGVWDMGLFYVGGFKPLGAGATVGIGHVELKPFGFGNTLPSSYAGGQMVIKSYDLYHVSRK